MHTVEVVLLLVTVCVGLALAARVLAVPYAVVLVLGGMLLAFIPGLPPVELNPELALAFFLPPLLQASAFRTDWRAFRANIRTILLLALGAVLFTTLVIAVVARWMIPELPWAAAIALGAIVAPPDAVAAASVLARVRLPRRLVAVLEGESLLNDASSLVLYRLAVAAVAAGSLAPLPALGLFALVAAGGAAIGYALGRIATLAFGRLNDPLLETTLSFLVCFASFLAAEALHVSGVIAVVVTGLVIGQAQHSAISPRTRLFSRAVWEFVEFLLNSLVFILIGLQLNGILDRLSERSTLELLGVGLGLSVALIAARFAWVFPVSLLRHRIRRWRGSDRPPPLKELVIVSWAGMRGVVSLAAALALPLDFPERDLLIFLAFCAILATLVVQGTTLEWVIRKVGVGEPAPADGIDPEEAEGRRIAAAAALEAIEARLDDPLEGAIAHDIVAEFRDRAGHLHRTAKNQGAARAERAARRRLRLLAMEAGRERLIAHHAEGGLHDEALSKLMQEIDLEELRVRQVLADSDAPPERGPAPPLPGAEALLRLRRAAQRWRRPVAVQ